jgi:predicted nucleotidyltransferase
MSGRTEKIDIDECIPSLVKYLDQQEDVLAAMIYGSYGTEFQTPLSDVDLAILFYRDRKPSVERLLALEAGIVAICRKMISTCFVSTMSMSCCSLGSLKQEG